MQPETEAERQAVALLDRYAPRPAQSIARERFTARIRQAERDGCAVLIVDEDGLPIPWLLRFAAGWHVRAARAGEPTPLLDELREIVAVGNVG